MVCFGTDYVPYTIRWTHEKIAQYPVTLLILRNNSMIDMNLKYYSVVDKIKFQITLLFLNFRIQEFFWIII